VRHRVVAVARAGFNRIKTISWVVACGFAAWAVARGTAADRVRRTENTTVPLLSFTPQVAAAAPWAALGLRLAGRRRPAAVVALAAAALGLVVRPRRIPRPQPDACGPMLRVLTLNMYFGRADAAALVARVGQSGTDVLFLQELTADAVTRLKQAGLDDLMPHSQLELWGGSRGSGIYSRFPLGEGPAVPPVRMAQPTALIELPGGQAVELVCVHPSPPAPGRPGGAARWRGHLAVLPPPGKLPRVLAGDYNATLDHAAFRDVLRLGYADAALQAGSALLPTWGPPGRGAVLTLDHVLVDRSCAVLGYSVHVIPGSDHRAVYAEIQLPER
jgi:endonuclease/exonuclease/phosphatase family metal-dependent hydrolase